MTSVKSRRGFALALVLLLLLCIGSMFIAFQFFRSGTTQDVEGDELSVQTLAVAESAADETSLLLGRAGNTRTSLTFGALRTADLLVRSRGPGPWLPVTNVTGEIFGQPMPGLASLIAEIQEGKPQPTFTIVDRRIEFTVMDRFGLPHPIDVRGELRIHVGIEGAGAKRRLRRAVTRRQGFRVSRLALPFPLDSLTFFSLDAWVAMERDPTLVVGRGIHEDLEKTYVTLDAIPQGISSIGPDLKERLDEARILFQPPDYGIYRLQDGRPFTFPGHSIYTHVEEDEINDLAAWRLGHYAHEFQPRFQVRRDAMVPVLRDIREGRLRGYRERLRGALDSLLDLADEYRSTVERYFEERVFLKQGSQDHRRAFDPGLQSLMDVASWKNRAWYRLESLQEFETMFPGGQDLGQPVARNGIVHLVPAGGAAVLTRTDVWGTSTLPGRLVVLVEGSCDVRGLTSPWPGQSLVTIIATGPMTVSQSVEACLVALGGLRLEDGASVTGNIAHLGGPFQVGTNVRVGRVEKLFTGTSSVQPRGDIHHLSLDPSLETIDVE